MLSRQMTRNDWSPISDVPSPSCETDVVMKIRPFSITGDDQPLPGIGFIQVMFCELLQLTGKSVALENPCPVGPRNSRQFDSLCDKPHSPMKMNTVDKPNRVHRPKKNENAFWEEYACIRLGSVKQSGEVAGGQTLYG